MDRELRGVMDRIGLEYGVSVPRSDEKVMGQQLNGDTREPHLYLDEWVAWVVRVAQEHQLSPSMVHLLVPFMLSRGPEHIETFVASCKSLGTAEGLAFCKRQIAELQIGKEHKHTDREEHTDQ